MVVLVAVAAAAAVSTLPMAKGRGVLDVDVDTCSKDKGEGFVMNCREAAFTTLPPPPAAVAQEGMMESLKVGFSPAPPVVVVEGGEAFKSEAGTRALGGEGGG